MKLLDKIYHFFNKGHARTVRARKNILLSILFKGLSILIGFIYFPLSLEYLGTAKFGVFLTIMSMIDYFLDLNIGIGYGLRNKFGEALAKGDHKQAVIYVSTAYFTIGAIILGLTILLQIGNLFIPWSDWLNTSNELSKEIQNLVAIIIIAFAIRFVAVNVYEIFYAMQKMAFVEFFSLLAKTTFLIIILLLIYFTKDSLLLFGSANSLTFALVPLVVGIYFFSTKFRKYRPSIRYVRLSYLKDLMSLGVKFFIIRMSMVIIHQTNNILIAGLVSVEGVPQYQAAYKYLSIFLMLFVILTNQLWSSNVEAYNKDDMHWMKKSMWTVLKIWVGTVFIASFMVLFSNFIYRLWLQDNLEIPMTITTAVAVSICLTTWVNMFNLVLNGTGKIKLQMLAWLFAAVINIPASIYFVKVLNFGIVGVVFGTIVSLIPLAIISPLQVIKILSKKEKGIWAQ